MIRLPSPHRLALLASAASLTTLAGCATASERPANALASLPAVAQVDERYQSYNVEMV